MKQAVIIVGTSIKNNKIFIEYLTRQIDKQINHIDNVYFLDRSSCDLFLEIEEIISANENIIICAKNGFDLVGKIVSTLTDDVLISQGDMLTPSKVVKFTKDSYLIKSDTKLINVLKVDELKNIPQILIQKFSNRCSFFLFSDNKGEDLEALKNLAISYDGNISHTTITKGLFFVELNHIRYQTQQGFIDMLPKRLHDKILFGEDFSKSITDKLMQYNKKITCAESCTGGMLSAEIVKHSGVSAIFDGGIVSYSNEIKHQILGVQKSTLENYGAVSKECVKEMLEGLDKIFEADFALAISGVAGPGGGSKTKPVGTVVIGVRTKSLSIIENIHFFGDRNYIQKQAVFYALKMLALSDKKLFLNKL